MKRGVLALAVLLAAGAGIAVAWVHAAAAQEVPDALSGTAAVMQADGWLLAARHPLACREPEPHVHLISPGGSLRMTVTAAGRIRLR